MGFHMLIGLIVAYFIYRDAQKSGQPLFTALLWAVASIPMPIVIVPLYLLFGRKPNLKKREDAGSDIIDIEATVVEETILCPMCGKKVQENLAVCPYCDYTLQPKCQSCGQRVERECKVCPYCHSGIHSK